MTEPPQADGQAAPDAPAAGVPDVGDAAAAAAPVAAAPPAAEAGLAAAAASGGGADSEPAWIDGACVYAMYKPRGMITTNKPNPRATATHRRACMGQWLQEIIQGEDGLRVFHIGRLDKKTTGLLLATSVGHFGRFICTPGMLPKEYIVTTERLVTPEMVQMLVDGVQLHDGFAKALEAELMETRVERREVTQGQASRNVKRSRGERKRKAQEMEALAAAPEAQDMPEGGATAATPAVSVEKVTCVVRMVISMGRNHIVKRMFDHIGLSVTRLHRSAIGPCRLETFGLTEPGQHAKVPSEVLRTLWQHRTVGTEVIESDAEDEGEN